MPPLNMEAEMDPEEARAFAEWRRPRATHEEPCEACGEGVASDRGLCTDCLLEHVDIVLEMEMEADHGE